MFRVGRDESANWLQIKFFHRLSISSSSCTLQYQSQLIHVTEYNGRQLLLSPVFLLLLSNRGDCNTILASRRYHHRHDTEDSFINLRHCTDKLGTWDQTGTIPYRYLHLTCLNHWLASPVIINMINVSLFTTIIIPLPLWFFFGRQSDVQAGPPLTTFRSYYTEGIRLSLG